VTNPQSDGLLTAEEQHAVHLAGELANILGRVVGQGPSRHADLTELIGHVHGIQRAVLAQAAARAHPGTYRLLGGSLDATPYERLVRRRWWHRRADPSPPLPHMSPCRPGSTGPVDYDG
jgi:hypothetical protein